jgi:hypothetical protein
VHHSHEADEEVLMLLGFGPAEILILLAPILLVVIPAWRIVSRAGFHGAWSLLILIPVINIVAIYVFAFIPWPSAAAPRDRYAEQV